MLLINGTTVKEETKNYCSDYPRSPDTGFLSVIKTRLLDTQNFASIMPRANLKNGILNFWRGQISDSIYHFLLVGIKRGDGFHIGFQKMDYVYFYGSSVRMGHPRQWPARPPPLPLPYPSIRSWG